MGGKKQNRPDAGFCLFGALALQKLTDDLLAEADGVRQSEDIEYIHRMRVASRRIRAALPLFAVCFPTGMDSRTRKGVRAITRSLGAARDLDVQIDFLNQYLDTLPPESPPVWHATFLPPGEETTVLEHPPDSHFESAVTRPARPKSPGLLVRIRQMLAHIRSAITGDFTPVVQTPKPPFEIPVRPGIECLLLRWNEMRRRIHPDVVCSVDTFEESGVGEELLSWCRQQIVTAELRGTDVHSRYTYEAAYESISTRLLELLSFERYVFDRTRIAQHHEMRIAAKRLRYTMEIFRELYPDNVKNPITQIKRLQDILGDMHDCDVWLETLPRFMDEEEARVVSFFGHAGFMRFIRPGILHLADDRRTRREELYIAFTRHWDAMKADGVIEAIRQAIATPLAAMPHSLHDADGAVRIAFIGDLHGNLPALLAVLADAKQRGVTHILHLGDIVGFGPFPEETAARIRDEEITGVAGNIDRETLALSKKDCPKQREGTDPKMHALCWTKKKLTKASIRHLRSLPAELRTEAGGNTILLTHGSPDSTTGRIGVETPDSDLVRYTRTAQADIIVTAHTHQPFHRIVNDCLFINCGSVGRPFDGDPRACYCILEANTRSLCHIRIPYDIDYVSGAIQKAGLPDIFCTMLRYGISMEEAEIHAGKHAAGQEYDGISADCTVNRSVPTIEPK